MLPNLIVIGAMKCGTTSLHRYLGAHPQIFMSAEKELNFFIAEATWGRGLEWYSSCFPTDRPVRGESSPSYAHYPYFAGVPERMRAVVPDAKLIYLVRDPVERIVSHWIHDAAAGREQRSLAGCLADVENSGYVMASRYFAQLERYLPWYPLERILVLRLEDLDRSREATLERVFRFLGVDESFRSARFGRVDHRSSEKRRLTSLGRRVRASAPSRALARLPAPVARRIARIALRPFSRTVEPPNLTPELRERVVTSLRPDGARLEALLGIDLSTWYG
jgi:hypothetical protein